MRIIENILCIMILKKEMPSKGSTMMRVRYIELFDFKNTEHGVIEFPTAGTDPRDLKPGADIVGIYGQNGSGKTSVIDALSILKCLLCGHSCRDDVVMDSFSPGSNRFGLAIGLDFSNKGVITDTLRYEAEFSRDRDKLWLSHEKISGRFSALGEGGSKPSSRTLIEIVQKEATAAPVFSPKGAWKSILGVDESVKTGILVSMGVAQRELRSLIVNIEVFHWLIRLASFAYVGDREDWRSANLQDCIDHMAWNPPADAPQAFKKTYEDNLGHLVAFIPMIGGYFANNVRIITTVDHAACSLQLMAVETENDGRGFDEPPFIISLAEPAELNEAAYRRICTAIEGVSGVMGTVVPGFSIEVKDLGARISDDGDEVRKVEFLSNRNGSRIPLRCESEGVRKLISLTTSLIQVHTHRDAFVAIDELDAGIFEYLLGELLDVLGSFGSGQLLFTAHNLRALEMLGAKDIVLATTNPKNRFIKFKGHRPTNNLRDQYLRAINLGGQDEEVYAATNKYAIDSALYAAGVATKGN